MLFSLIVQFKYGWLLFKTTEWKKGNHHSPALGVMGPTIFFLLPKSVGALMKAIHCSDLAQCDLIWFVSITTCYRQSTKLRIKENTSCRGWVIIYLNKTIPTCDHAWHHSKQRLNIVTLVVHLQIFFKTVCWNANFIFFSLLAITRWGY